MDPNVPTGSEHQKYLYQGLLDSISPNPDPVTTASGEASHSPLTGFCFGSVFSQIRGIRGL